MKHIRYHTVLDKLTRPTRLEFNQMFKRKNQDNKEDYLIRTFEKDDVIVSEGDETKEMFIIQTGQVAIEKNHQGKPLLLKVLEKADFFGEMSLMEGLPRSATVRALTTTKVLVLHSGSFMMKLRRDPTFAFEMINQLCHRIRTENDRLIQLMIEAGISNEIAQDIFQKPIDE